MSDLNERIEEPDITKEFTLSDDELADVGDEDVDLDDTESIDEVKDLEAEEINPVFGDDQEVIADNLNYDE